MFDLDHAQQGKTYQGKYKAFVRNNADPERRGRIMVFCPQVMGDESDVEAGWIGWCEPCFPWLGGLNTLDFGPPLTKTQNGGVEVGVWIEFEMGRVDFPIWVGTWLPAPTPDDPNAQIDLSATASRPTGDILDDPPPGSTVAAINPMKPEVDAQEVRLVVKGGRDILIGSNKGGGILIGPSGVHIVGPQVTFNGQLVSASKADSMVR